MLRKIFPFINWFPMTKDGVRNDVVAGVTVALLLIPQSMAYAELAGMPAYYGLYASFIPVIIGALFGSLPQLGSGPVALTGILTASVLGKYAVAGSDKFIQFAILLAIVVGVLRILLGVFKLANFINLISHPVVIGFTNGAALIICFSQLNKVLGVDSGMSTGIGGFLLDIQGVLSRVGESHFGTVCFGLASVALLWGIKKRWEKFPVMLVVMILSILLSWLLNFEASGGKVVGQIPAGMPMFSIPEWNWAGSENLSMWQATIRMIPDALVICFIGFMELIAVGKAISMQTKQPLDANQELIGQGIASLTGGFFSCYPTSVSFSRSAMNLMMGARTGLCSLVTAFVVLLALLFFTPQLYFLPKATLAACIIMAVYPLMKFGPMVIAMKASKADGFAAVLTFITTILFAPNIIIGVLIGASMAIALHLYRTMKPSLEIIKDYSEIDPSISYDAALSDSVIVVRFNGSLFFASVSYFETKLLEAMQTKMHADYILVIADGINRIDASGEWGLRQLNERLKENEFRLVFSGLHSKPKEVLRNTGLLEEIGEDAFYLDAKTAISSIHSEVNEDIFMI